MNRKFTAPKQNRGGGFKADKKQEAPLTGVVQTMKAAQGEERLSRTFNRSMQKGLMREYKFRMTTAARKSIYYKELDFLAIKSNGEAIAISVKGKAFVHFGGKAKEQDKINEALILTSLRSKGYNVGKIETVYDLDLLTQDAADKAAKKLGLYR
jgi:hypothetical protein